MALFPFKLEFGGIGALGTCGSCRSGGVETSEGLWVECWKPEAVVLQSYLLFGKSALEKKWRTGAGAFGTVTGGNCFLFLFSPIRKLLYANVNFTLKSK